jgi:putative phage-type endonuclease
MPATREEWLEMRRNYVGASESAALLGMGAGFSKSPLSLYLIKRGELVPQDEDNERIREGVRRENEVALSSSALAGRKLLPAVYAVHDRVHGMAASLDRVVLPSEADIEQGRIGPGALECKIVYSDAYRRDWRDGPPAYYLIQNQHQMACSGYLWGEIAAIVVNPKTGQDEGVPRFTYAAHPELIGRIEEAVAEFWDRVRLGIPPDPDGHKSTRDALRAMFPAPQDEEVDLQFSNSLPMLARRYARMTALEARLKKSKQQISNDFRAAMGTAKRARLAGKITITRTVSEDTPDRPALPGEIIKGRKGSDQIRVNVPKDSTR